LILLLGHVRKKRGEQQAHDARQQGYALLTRIRRKALDDAMRRTEDVSSSALSVIGSADA